MSFAEKFSDPAEVLAALREMADPDNREPEGTAALAAAALKLLGVPEKGKLTVWVAERGVYENRGAVAAYLSVEEAKTVEPGKSWTEYAEGVWCNDLADEAHVELRSFEVTLREADGAPSSPVSEYPEELLRRVASAITDAEAGHLNWDTQARAALDAAKHGGFA